MLTCSDERSPHALVVPASEQGHINACMLLARSLADLGFQVSYVYFSSEYTKLTSKKRLAEPDPAGLVRIHVVKDAFGPGDIHKLFFYTDAMQENLLNLIIELREQGTPVTCLIGDTFVPWTFHVAERAGIPLVNYWTSNAKAYLLAAAVPLLFSQGYFPEKGVPAPWKRETPLMLDVIPGLAPFSSELYPRNVRFVDASDPFVSLLCEVAWCGAKGERVLIHTMSELEPDAFYAMEARGIRAYAIGSLLQHATQQEPSIASSPANQKVEASQPDVRNECTAWLNTQVESSVIYIAFGSHAIISVNDVRELAHGLEASGNPFLWVIREDLRRGAELADVLPNGFLHRMTGKGMIVSWAPQMEVLAHKAIGGFLSHCGWNSTLECLWEGLPMLCCACFAEQLSNSHYLCELWGVGLELERTDTGGIDRVHVEVGVKALMQEEEGVKARAKAEEVMQLMRKTCQQGGEAFNSLQKFFTDMKELCTRSTHCH